jgi:hypothetical protein
MVLAALVREPLEYWPRGEHVQIVFNMLELLMSRTNDRELNEGRKGDDLKKRPTK